MATLEIETLRAMSAEQLSALLAPGSPDRVAAIRLTAEAGHADAQAALGQMLLDGRELPQDQAAAIGWFHKAAEQGHAMAVNMIGRCFELGWGVPVDKARAAQWFKAAADRGLDWGLYNYAKMLAEGTHLLEDKPGALALLRKAAGMGHAKSINLVGSFYEDGLVVAKDLAAAAEHYRLAAEGGDFRGCFNHARMLIYAGDIEGALRWIGRIRESATPAFIAKTEAWLHAAPDTALRDRGIAALHGLR
ncbi:sel1 repeat family protein [Novosphingobium sp. G106]|uniref:tetratricopeptide repeat protein n=1 Tax=Novosphingobium sp. G106 TaxID=2849500 RepID=UPI001C2D5DA4|nr:tetratricopeptide repeat protein [Novosphingobium sp. G106]MBV1688124.1 sel1 repeat family protein [Novosphingobium sp. G106]